MKRAWLVVAALALFALLFAQQPRSAPAQVSPCPSGFIPFGGVIYCSGSPGPTGAPTSTPTGTPTSTPTPGGTPTPLDGATPQPFAANASEANPPAPYIQPSGSGVGTAEYTADRIADGFGINAQTCQSSTAFSANPTTGDLMGQDFMRGGVRHVRTGIQTCYNETAADTFYNTEYQAGVLGQLAGLGSLQPQPFLASLPSQFPQVEAVEGLNEGDTASGSSAGNVTMYSSSGTIAAGSTDFACGYGTGTTQCSSNFFSGVTLKVEDSNPNHVEYVVPSENQPDAIQNPGNAWRTTMQITSPTLFAHASGTPLVRWNAVTNSAITDYVPEALAYFTYTNPQIRLYMNYGPALGLSFGHPIFSSNFSIDGLGYAGANVEVGNVHSYPVPSTLPPEGTNGDWYQGYGPNHTPCTGNYSFMSDARCSSNQVAGPQRENILAWQTEYGRSCVDSTSYVPSGSSGSALPPSVCEDYMAALYMGQRAHGISRTYWFLLKDGQDGASYYLCPSGMVADPTTCGGTGAPFTKPMGTAFLALANWFTDPGCRHSIDSRKQTCSFTPTPVNGTWSNTAEPFNAQGGFQWSNGQIAIPFWSGALEYSTSPSGSCASTVTCTTAVSPISETFSSPLLSSATNVHLVQLDNNPNDPIPAAVSYPLADGTTTNEPETWCNNGPLSTAYFGCLYNAGALTVTGTSVSVTATREMQYIVFTPAGATPTVTATAVATYTPLPIVTAPPAPSPPPTPAPTATPTPGAATPAPTATPTPYTTASPFNTLARTTNATSGTAAAANTFTFPLTFTPIAGDTLVMAACESGYAGTAGLGATPTFSQTTNASMGPGGPGELYVLYRISDGTETNITVKTTNASLTPAFWSVRVFDVKGAVNGSGPIFVQSNAQTTLNQTTANNNGSAGTLLLASFCAANSSTGPATSGTTGLASASWFDLGFAQTSNAAVNNIVTDNAYETLPAASNGVNLNTTIGGSNLTTNYGAAAIIKLNTPTPSPAPTATPTATPAPTATPTPAPTATPLQSIRNGGAFNSATSAPAQSFTFNLGFTPTAGDTLVLAACESGYEGNAGLGATPAFTQTNNQNISTLGNLYVAYRTATGSESSITVNTTNASGTKNVLWAVQVFDVYGSINAGTPIFVQTNSQTTLTQTTNNNGGSIGTLMLASFCAMNSSTGPATSITTTYTQSNSPSWTDAGFTQSGNTTLTQNPLLDVGYVTLAAANSSVNLSNAISGSNLTTTAGGTAIIRLSTPSPSPT